jgi:hypothetical protein
MQKVSKSPITFRTPVRLERTTSAAPIPIDERFTTLSLAEASEGRTSYHPIVVLVPNTAAFERMVAQLMPVHQSGLRLTEGHVRHPVPPPEEWSGTDAETHSFGEVVVNIPEMTVRRKGKIVTLALKEFRMLEYFVKNPGRVIARDELLNEVWGYQNYPCTRTVDNHILRLRQKLEAEPSSPKHFLTIHSSGYKFVG